MLQLVGHGRSAFDERRSQVSFPRSLARPARGTTAARYGVDQTVATSARGWSWARCGAPLPTSTGGCSVGSLRVAGAGFGDPDGAAVGVDQVPDPAAAGYLDLPARQPSPVVQGVGERALQLVMAVGLGGGCRSVRIACQAVRVFPAAWWQRSSQPLAAEVLPKRTSHSPGPAGGAALSPRFGLTRRVLAPGPGHLREV